jgi:4-amino-4-deoxy-L-arabinose transferase-like glycosyltransferase
MERAHLDDPTTASAGGHAGSADAPSNPARTTEPTIAFGWSGAVAVLTLAAILFCARLGLRALWSSEFRWAEVAREMILTRNYFWPTINGSVYYDKPLGSYWMVVASTWVTGGMNEAAARLPCAIAGIIAVLLLILLVQRLYDLATAAMAAGILATSFSFVFFSRHASADVETIAGELAALLLFLRNEDKARGWWVVGLWLIMAVTSLMKGLLGFALPLVVIGAYSCLADGWAELGRHTLRGPLAARLRWLVERNRWFFNWRTLIAVAIAGVVYYAPFSLSRAATGSSKGLHMVYRENVERYFEPFDHRGPVYLYTYVIFALMAPWSVFLPAALVQAHHRRRTGADHSHSDRFVLVYFWATLAFFTLSGSRRSYYLLPILPTAAMLVARLLREPSDNATRWAQRLLNAGYYLIALGVAVSVLAFFPPHLFLPYPYSLLPKAPVQPMLAIYWLGSLAAIGYALRRLCPERIFLSTAVVAYLFMTYYFVFAMPAADAWRGEKPFAHQVKGRVGAATDKLAFFKVVGPVFYLDSPKPVPEYGTLGDLDAAIGDGRVRWLVVRRRDLDRLNVPARVAASEPVYPWDPKEHILNSMVLVQVSPPNNVSPSRQRSRAAPGEGTADPGFFATRSE